MTAGEGALESCEFLLGILVLIVNTLISHFRAYRCAWFQVLETDRIEKQLTSTAGNGQRKESPGGSCRIYNVSRLSFLSTVIVQILHLKNYMVHEFSLADKSALACIWHINTFGNKTYGATT